jgi:RNA polymerase sigma factor (sigma-70 family)
VRPPARQRQTPYEEHKGYVLRVLAKHCSWLNQEDREAAYHDAYVILLEKERAGTLDVAVMQSCQVRAYLARASFRQALGQRRSAYRRRVVATDDAALARPDPSAAPEEQGTRALEAAPVRELIEELPERQRKVIKLRFYFDLSPNEIQRLLGLSDRIYRKEIERAFRQLARRYELVRDGRWCEARRSLVIAYVAGVAGPRKMAEARMHLSSCPGCAQMAAELRRAAEHAAALIPAPDLVVHHGVVTRAAEAASSVKGQLADLIGAAKQHASGAVARVDPSAGNYAAGVRPGTAATVIAGCLALGGGATYCAVEGLPGPFSSSTKEEHAVAPPGREPKKQTGRPGAGSHPPPAPVPVAPSDSEQPPETVTAPAAPPPPPAEPGTPPVQNDFDFEAAASSPPPATSGGSDGAAPRSAPATGAGEFAP